MKCEGYVQVSKEGMQAAPLLGEADGRRGAAAVQHCRVGTEELGVLVGGGTVARVPELAKESGPSVLHAQRATLHS
uniref:Uncharacterized protein n=1 Tax=Oryza meridionalis TaxID=40149 RepID=A0A0E0EM54_9ORYZ